jgi:hypothetical protein
MFLEATLHILEFVNAFHPLGLFLREDKARESLSELWTARTMGHSTKTRTIPIDLASFRVERALGLGFLR